MKKAYHSTSDFLVHQKYGRYCLPKSSTSVQTYVGFYDQNITGGQEAKCCSIVDPFKLTKLGQL
jgi:hypothetical protein